jgi:anti-anti-sigma factor
MEITKTTDGEIAVLSLDGRLDTTTAPKLQEALLGEIERNPAVRLDFAKLAYVSSAGLRVLLMGEKSAKAKSKRMTLVNVPNDIMEVLDMTGFTGVLNIEG